MERFQIGVLKWSVALCLAAALRSLSAPSNAEGPSANAGTKLVDVEDGWVAIGPFADRPAAERFDFLEAAGYGHEGQISAATVKRLESIRAGQSAYPLARRFGDAPFIDFFIAYDINKEKKSKPTFYLYRRLYSGNPRTVFLALGSDSQVRVWVNGSPASFSPRVRRLENRFSDVVPLQLHTGNNDVLIKLAGVSASCGYTGEMFVDATSAFSFVHRTHATPFQRVVLGPGMQFGASFPDLPREVTFKAELLNDDGAVIARADSLSAAGEELIPANIRAGLYYVRSTVGTDTKLRPLLIGSVDDISQNLTSMLDGLTGPSDLRQNAAALEQRARSLLDPQNRKADSLEWQIKAVWTLSELREAIMSLQKGSEAEASKPGIHIRAFTSSMDGLVRHYRIFIPNGYSRSRPVPLLIMTATSMSAVRPFIDSAFVAHHRDAEKMGELAVKYGVAVVWPGYPAEPYGNPGEITHLIDVLNNVRSAYAIDSQRISVLGTCRAGMTALMTAQSLPGRFAGIGLLDPIMDRTHNRQNEPEIFTRFRAYKDWLEAHAPLKHLEKLRGTAVLIVHDDGGPTHGTVRDVLDFVDAAKQADLKYEFCRERISLDHELGWSRIFGWAAEQRRDVGSDIRFPFPEQGAVADVLARPFIVVVGTNGTPAERASCRQLAEKFVRDWESVHFGRCRIRSDVDVTTEELKSTELVLVGNASTNTIWHAVQFQLPVQVIDSHYVSISGRRIEGERLFFEVLATNPLATDHHLVLLGAADVTTAEMDALDQAADGWFDYAVWSVDGGSSRPVLKIAERYR